MDTFFALIMMSVVVEGLVTYFKTFFVDGVFQWQILTGIVVGILVAVAYQIDLMAICGLTSIIPYLGCILTGIMLSRGSNYIFDLVGHFTKDQLRHR